jgi:hypothetical protein
LAVFVEQDKYLAIFGAKRIDRGVDLVYQLSGVVRRPAIGDFVQVIGNVRPLASAANPCPASVHRDTEHPRPQGSGVIPSGQTAEDAQEHFLRHILGVVSVGEQPTAHSQDIGLKLLDQFARRRLVTAQTPVYERGIGGHGLPSVEIYPRRSSGFQKWDSLSGGENWQF